MPPTPHARLRSAAAAGALRSGGGVVGSSRGVAPAIDRPKTEWHKSSASKGNPDPGGIIRNAGRYHVGTVAKIISECLGDFIGIRI